MRSGLRHRSSCPSRNDPVTCEGRVMETCAQCGRSRPTFNDVPLPRNLLLDPGPIRFIVPHYLSADVPVLVDPGVTFTFRLLSQAACRLKKLLLRPWCTADSLSIGGRPMSVGLVPPVSDEVPWQFDLDCSLSIAQEIVLNVLNRNKNTVLVVPTFYGFTDSS